MNDRRNDRGRRPRGRAADRKAGPKRDRKFALSVRACERLDVHVSMTPGATAAGVVETLIITHLTRWVVQDRGGPGAIAAAAGDAA